MEYRLDEIFDLQMGKTPDRKRLDYFVNSGNKWISIADISKADKFFSHYLIGVILSRLYLFVQSLFSLYILDKE